MASHPTPFGCAGAMRMLPNGEVVPIPAAERRASVQPAPAGGLELGGMGDQTDEGIVSLPGGMGCPDGRVGCFAAGPYASDATPCRRQ